MDVRQTGYVSTIVCARRQRVYTLPLRHKEEYFVKYQDIPLAKPSDGLKYGEHQLDNIWIWVCWSQVYGHDGCKTHYIAKSKKHALP
jgi:hypothetical protein